ncbi:MULTISPECIES: hypothetical protein [Pseudomonadota]|nr:MULTISPECIES: hypothetical protein [Pseudomonadota]
MSKKVLSAAGVLPAMPIRQTVSGESSSAPMPKGGIGGHSGIKFYTGGA